MNSIGGELKLTLMELKGEIVPNRRLPCNKSNHVFVDLGRSALFLALQNILEKGGKREAWVPRYCCESILVPFRQLKFSVNFYSMGSGLCSTETLPSSLEGSTFLFINYFGKKNRWITQWLSEFTKATNESFFVIEDCVQASLSENVGDEGDYAIYSYRKFLPQPDGALLAFDEPFDFQLEDPSEAFISQKLVGKMLRGGNGEDATFLKLFATAEKRIEQKICPRNISWFSSYLLERTDIAAVSKKRIENWNYLVDNLTSRGLLKRRLELLFNSLEEGEVPLGLPVIVLNGSRDELKDFLFSNSIYCPIHWCLADIDDSYSWDSELQLSSSILTLPLDQNLSKYELDYMVRKLSEFIK